MAVSDIIQLLGKGKPMLEFNCSLKFIHDRKLVQMLNSLFSDSSISRRQQSKHEGFVFVVGLEVGSFFNSVKKNMNKKIMTPAYCEMCKENVTVSSGNSNSNTCHITGQNLIKSLQEQTR